jgi:outer membrane receptor protein involved in Fe transport
MFYGYANDDWHIRKNFSLNVGLRYEFTQVPLSQRLWQPMNAFSSVPGLISFGAPQTQKKNFLPRWTWVYFQAPRADGLSDSKEAAMVSMLLVLRLEGRD